MHYQCMRTADHHLPAAAAAAAAAAVAAAADLSCVVAAG
jgi:hypothetical protein